MAQAGCYQLVLDRKLGECVLPDGWVVIAAGNPASERGVHFAMPRPSHNRFVHLDLEPDLDDWCRWAVKAQVRPEIIVFLRFKSTSTLRTGEFQSGDQISILRPGSQRTLEAYYSTGFAITRIQWYYGQLR
jgi:hypothetical protein